jgi:hypothetical protein
MRSPIGYSGRHYWASNANCELGHASKTRGVRPRAARYPHHKIVARNLALQIDLPRDPMHHGVYRKQGLDDALHHQRATVAARYVRRLVQADLLQFCFIQSFKKMPRK